jgi:hypothetical protein
MPASAERRAYSAVGFAVDAAAGRSSGTYDRGADAAPAAHWWLKQEDDISLTTTVWISPIRIAKETAASGLAPPAILLADNSPDLLSFVAGFFYLTITLNIIYFRVNCAHHTTTCKVGAN